MATITRSIDAKTWDLGGAHFTPLASPSRGGSVDVAMWRRSVVATPGRGIVVAGGWRPDSET